MCVRISDCKSQFLEEAKRGPLPVQESSSHPFSTVALIKSTDSTASGKASMRKSNFTLSLHCNYWLDLYPPFPPGAQGRRCRNCPHIPCNDQPVSYAGLREVTLTLSQAGEVGPCPKKEYREEEVEVNPIGAC